LALGCAAAPRFCERCALKRELARSPQGVFTHNLRARHLNHIPQPPQSMTMHHCCAIIAGVFAMNNLTKLR
ncbi:hypothetical protein, partial [Pseudomonas prosekii]